MQSLVPGILIEVLWDIELIKWEGRRRGERSLASVWWRAELLSKEVVEGRVQGKLKYVAREGFDEQHATVWILPDYIRLIEDDTTQLRWRYYECSGQVSYKTDGENTIRQRENGFL